MLFPTVIPDKSAAFRTPTRQIQHITLWCRPASLPLSLSRKAGAAFPAKSLLTHGSTGLMFAGLQRVDMPLVTVAPTSIHFSAALHRLTIKVQDDAQTGGLFTVRTILQKCIRDMTLPVSGFPTKLLNRDLIAVTVSPDQERTTCEVVPSNVAIAVIMAIADSNSSIQPNLIIIAPSRDHVFPLFPFSSLFYSSFELSTTSFVNGFSSNCLSCISSIDPFQFLVESFEHQFSQFTFGL